MDKLFARNRIKKLILHIVNIAVNSIFVKKCLICNMHLVYYFENYICENCKNEIKIEIDNTCKICSIQIPKGQDSICGQCLLSHPPYNRHISFTIYKDKIRKIILLYKLSEIQPLKHYISSLYLKIIDEYFKGKFDVIISVPVDSGRKRTFEPVSKISDIISSKTGAKHLKGVLVKVRSTKKQSSLNYNERIKNLNRAFEINSKEKIVNKRILLIDDVYTTGTTVKKCSKLLNKYAESVVVITLARSANLHLK